MKITENTFLALSKSKGYWPREAMQVMELWPNVVTVKCEKGCMTKPYEDFDVVEDLSGFKTVYYSPYFEDNTKS